MCFKYDFTRLFISDNENRNFRTFENIADFKSFRACSIIKESFQDKMKVES